MTSRTLTVPAVLFSLLILVTRPLPADTESPRALDLDFEAAAGRLSGTLFLPAGDGPFPAVVFIEGSGDSSYREGWKAGERRPWFWPELQTWFEQRGHAVYLHDKPGVGRSEGDWRGEDFNDRADNVIAALRAVAAYPAIDPARIGVLGHSQGGWIGVIAASRWPDEVAYVVSLAGPAIGVRQQIIEDTTNRWQCDGRRLLGLRRAGLGAMLSTLGAAGRVLPAGYLARIVRYDPAEDLARIERPMLALFAGNDIMVMPESNIAPLERHFGRISGNRQLIVASVEGVDHFFREGAFCLGGPRPQSFAPGFWEAMETPAFWQSVEFDRD
ncbi:MAG: alpha/beta fold hydrolase [Gammaproteobacteria bacterium]|nr:alpha/beta fold hydrolase [Gammaproteobacteria bacterium]